MSLGPADGTTLAVDVGIGSCDTDPRGLVAEYPDLVVVAGSVTAPGPGAACDSAAARSGAHRGAPRAPGGDPPGHRRPDRAAAAAGRRPPDRPRSAPAVRRQRPAELAPHGTAPAGPASGVGCSGSRSTAPTVGAEGGVRLLPPTESDERRRPPPGAPRGAPTPPPRARPVGTAQGDPPLERGPGAAHGGPGRLGRVADHPADGRHVRGTQGHRRRRGPLRGVPGGTQPGPGHRGLVDVVLPGHAVHRREDRRVAAGVRHSPHPSGGVARARDPAASARLPDVADETRVVEPGGWREAALPPATTASTSSTGCPPSTPPTRDPPGFDVVLHLYDAPDPAPCAASCCAPGCPTPTRSQRSRRCSPGRRGTSGRRTRCSAWTFDGLRRRHRPRPAPPAAARRVRGHAAAQVLRARRAGQQALARREGAGRERRARLAVRAARCCRPGVPDAELGAARCPEALEVVVRASWRVLAAFLVLPLLVGQTEHKVMAHMQGRLGPMYAGGFHGWAQLVADGVKFAQKEDVIPAAADRRVFPLAPAVALVPYLVAMVAIPVAPGVVGRRPGRRPALRPGRQRGRRARHADGGLGQRQQVRPARRHARRRAAAVVRAADRAGRQQRRDGRRHALADRDRRGVAAVVAALAGPAAWSSSWPASPSCRARRSTCRSPTPRSSSARTPSTPGCASRSSCSPSTPASSCCRR